MQNVYHQKWHREGVKLFTSFTTAFAETINRRIAPHDAISSVYNSKNKSPNIKTHESAMPIKHLINSLTFSLYHNFSRHNHFLPTPIISLTKAGTLFTQNSPFCVIIHLSPNGGIGIRVRLKIEWRNPYGFKSHFGHH